MEIKFKKYRLTAILDDGSMKEVYIKAPHDAPIDYLWIMAINECNNFISPLQQLCFNGLNEVVMENNDVYAAME